MEFNYYNELKNKIESSEYVLIGIGEEFEISALEMLSNQKMIARTRNLPKSIQDSFFRDVIVADFMNNYDGKQLNDAYKNLFDLIKDKKYFIVSVNKDRLPIHAGFDENLAVFPMGGYQNLQCSNNCQKAVIDSAEYVSYFLQYFDKYDQISQEDKDAFEHTFEIPTCPFCGADLTFNYYQNENNKEYCEAGYIDMWQEYLKFLQKTINHSLCVIELGVSSHYESIIRSAFEKTVFFNNKSSLFRIHSFDCGIKENIQDKSYLIKQNALEFITKL